MPSLMRSLYPLKDLRSELWGQRVHSVLSPQLLIPKAHLLSTCLFPTQYRHIANRTGY